MNAEKDKTPSVINVPIEIKLEGEVINRMLAEAVINSTFGTLLKQRIQHNLGNPNEGYSNWLSRTVEDAIDRTMRDFIVEYMKSEYFEKIRQKIREKLENDTLDKIVTSIIEKFGKGY